MAVRSRRPAMLGFTALLLAFSSCGDPAGLGLVEALSCPEDTCVAVEEAYISHFAELDCMGAEAYYTPYFEYDGVIRSWDGKGIAGTKLRTLTHRSFRIGDACQNAWPAGNTLDDFVRIYR